MVKSKRAAVEQKLTIGGDNLCYVTICLEPYAIQYDKLQEKFESAQEMEQKKRCLDEMITWADEIAERVETVHNNNTAII